MRNPEGFESWKSAKRHNSDAEILARTFRRLGGAETTPNELQDVCLDVKVLAYSLGQVATHIIAGRPEVAGSVVEALLNSPHVDVSIKAAELADALVFIGGEENDGLVKQMLAPDMPRGIRSMASDTLAEAYWDETISAEVMATLPWDRVELFTPDEGPRELRFYLD